LLHFDLTDFPVSFKNIKIPLALLFTFHQNIAHHIPEMLIFYADKVLAMGRSGNLRVFNFMKITNIRCMQNIPVLQHKEIWVSPKVKILLSGTLSQTLDIENFATAR